MSSRPSARYNDPGFFYNQKKLLKIFAIVSALMAIGILLMVHADWARPWKRDQVAAMKWEARKNELEAMVLDTRTQDEQVRLAQMQQVAQAAFDAREEELEKIQKQLPAALGAFKAADDAYKAQKQFTGAAVYAWEHAHGEDEVAETARKLAAERDKEARLKERVSAANGVVDSLRAQEKKLRAELDAVVEKLRKDKSLTRLELLKASRDKKRGYNPLRTLPLLDFLAPPTKVEQVVLENLVDNYEFSLPKKVDRCGTCHVGIMRLGFESQKWPLEALEMEAGTKKAEMLEEGVYSFVFTLLDSVWPKVPADDPFPYENKIRRTLEIHHQVLEMMFLDYSRDDGVIAKFEKGPKKGRKAWRRWRWDEEKARWVSGTKGTSMLDYYYGLLQRMEKHWRSHPFLEDMVGSTSPHPYEKVGCTTCHQGRGWSTDFGFAYHVPDRVEIDSWMTVARAEEMHKHLPETTDLNIEQAMIVGALNAYQQRAWERVPELEAEIAAANGDKGGSDNPDLVALKAELEEVKKSDAYTQARAIVADHRRGWVTDDETGHRWHDELDWTHRKLHHWDWPQLPKTLVQASCLKCHREGLYRSIPDEYGGVQLGKPKSGVPDTKARLVHLKAHNKADGADYSDRMFVPEEEETYDPAELRAGMDSFLRFGCYGCHKLDPEVYPFMKHQRSKVGPQLDGIVSKTTKEWTRKWVRNPKDYRPNTRMPRFFGLSNNTGHFDYRFAGGDGSEETVDGDAWSNAEIYAIVEWMFEESGKNNIYAPPAVDLSKGDAKNGERILVAFGGTTDRAPKACIACHDVPIQTEELKVKAEQMRSFTDPASGKTTGWGPRMTRRQGPDLEGLGSKLKPEWLVAWLKNPRGYWHDTNMPDLRLTDQEALDVAAYLMSLRHDDFDGLEDVKPDMALLTRIAEEIKVGEQREPTATALGIVAKMTERERTLYVGKELFKSYGCFGCHSVKEYADTPPIGTELSAWGSKLIDRLAFNHVPIEKTRFDFAYTKMMNPRIYDHGTAGSQRPLERLLMPRFGFTSDEGKQLATFLLGLVEDPIPDAALFKPDERQEMVIEGRHLVRRYNCKGCHVIEGEGGDIWPIISESKWRPPDLIGQGIKTNPDWLFRFMKNPAFVAIDGQEDSDRVRPWHSIRMPTFGLTDDESRAIVRYFAAISGGPIDFETQPDDSLVGPDAQYDETVTRRIKDPDDAEGKKQLEYEVSNRFEEAEVLFTALACKSCHDKNADIATAAPNFRHTREGRLRPEWIRIWLWNPAKLQEGTAMPAFFADANGPKTDFKDFHGGVPDAQIRALRDYIRWHYVDDDGEKKD